MPPCRPNILLIVTDQQRANHLGCAAHPLLQTPYIDSLAAAGVRATRFHAASTTCMSNRATLMTGRMPSLHGVIHNGINLSRDHVTFVDLFKAAGYETSLIGKSHFQAFGYDSPQRRQWTNTNGGTPPPEELIDASRTHRAEAGLYDNEWTPDWLQGRRHSVGLPYYGFDHVELATLHGDQVQGDYANWLNARHPGANALRGRENALPDSRYNAPQAWRTGLPENLYPSYWVGERACHWLDQYVERSGSRPFLLKLSFPDPHHPFTPPGRFWDLYNPQKIELPSSFLSPGNSVFVSDVKRYTREGGSRDGYGAFNVSPRECQEILALTFGMISFVDQQVGRVLNHLKHLGLEQNTVIVFTSDHGDMMGDHGMVLKGAMHFDGLTRVPFIWRDPQSSVLGSLMEYPASTLDIAQTLLDRCGLAPFNGMQGLSLLPWLTHPTNRGPERPGVFVESEPVILPHGRTIRYRLRSLISSEWRITISNVAELCELYDLQSDPLEQHNVWNENTEMRANMCLQMLIASADQADRSPLPAAVA